MIRVLPLLLLSSLASAQTTRPATTKHVWATLAAGEIRYTEPPNWRSIPLTNAEDMRASYKNEAGNAVVTINVTPQQQPIPNTPIAAQSLGRQIVKAIRADLEKSGAEIIEPPKLERDERFFVRIRDKISLNGITSDRLHLYRALGYNLVMVSVDADNQSSDEVKAAYGVGEEVLDGTLLGKREKKPATTRPIRPKASAAR